MDASDKIIVLHSLDELKEAIIADTTSQDVLAQRYCVRFIMLNNFEAFREVYKFLVKELNVELLDIENLAKGEDKTITVDTLSDAVKGITKSTLVTPFSELVRFYNVEKFNGFFNEIILTEDIKNPIKRIYIPIIGLHNRFSDFLKSFGRIEESAPIWQYYTSKDDKVMVYVSRFKHFTIPEKLNICSLATMRDWLRFWKALAPKDKILCGARPILNCWQNSKPDSIFTFQPIDNAHTFIIEFLELNIPIQYVEDESQYWEKLLNHIGKSNSTMFDLSRFVEKHFNRMTISISDVLELWASDSTDEFGRWLLKYYALNFKAKELPEYLRIILEETNDFQIGNSLFVSVAERIFYATPAERERYFGPRKKLMYDLRSEFRTLTPPEHQDWVKEQIITIAQNDDSLAQAKRYCTSTYDFEDELFLGWYVLRGQKDFGLSHIQEYFPELYGYLTPFETLSIKQSQSWASEYFNQFRAAKIKDTITDTLADLLKQRNVSAESFYDWYFGFEESHGILADIVTTKKFPVDKVYWVDGLGAEFIPYILYLLDQSNSGYDAVLTQVARTNIPSNTHLNSFEVDNKKIFKKEALDELAHDGHYQKYLTLIKELKTVRQIIEDILNDNKVGKHTIAIVSDHGLSAMSRNCESLKLDSNTKHEGRYVLLDSDSGLEHDVNFVVHTNEYDGKKYKVALCHASLGKKPTHEVHGGATPEEVLVPFIVITNDDLAKPLTFAVKPKETSIPVSDKKVSFTIMPAPQSATVIFNGQEIPLTKNGLQWVAMLSSATEGKHQLTVMPFRGKPVQIEIEIYGMGFSSALSDFEL
ncbi:BREX-4 system phosphatase PglZ [Bacteroides thetaiotaomicron]|uniref:BREX-4 system phosphatase PglZ n=1 Tax=Bacteroides thetaiotaomicron TaxID=818 RepID=UPI003854F2B9